MSRGIIQNAIENKIAIGVELREFSDGETTFESELLTIADLIVPGTGHSLSAELECLLRGLIANGER